MFLNVMPNRHHRERVAGKRAPRVPRAIQRGTWRESCEVPVSSVRWVGRMNATVRTAEPADRAALAKLIGQLGYEVTEAQAVERLATMQAEDRLVLVAERDGGVIGCLSTSLMRVLHRPAPV